LTPEGAERQPAFQEGIAVFDFSLMSSGLQGYCWDFPSVVNGTPVMNRGIFDSHIRSERLRIPFKQAFQQSLARRKRHLNEYPLNGFPIHCFDDDGCFSGPRVLFVGDAAGVDPFFGEGISFALAYGQVAAEAIIDAFPRQTLEFADYKQRILSHPILRQLSVRAHIARTVYKLSRHPAVIPWFWKIVPLLFRGLVWYRPHYVPINQPRMIRVLS
jgi:flavin-dependent dehydrogenase